MTAPAPRPVVLVLVGTDHHPFDRLVGWADAWAADHADLRVVVQHGASRTPADAEGHDVLPVPELRALLREAVAVVCHGGPGTIMEVRDAGLVPLVAPRRPELGEHVDDHQVRFVARMASAGLVEPVEDGDAFAEMLGRTFGDADAFRIGGADAQGVDQAARSAARFGTLVEDLVATRARKP